MKVIKERIKKLKPRYHTSFESILKSYAQFGGGSEDDKFSKARSFSSVYEMYIYAFFLGLRRQSEYQLQATDPTKTFWEVENWKPADVVDTLITCAIAESNFDLVKSELIEIDDLRTEISLIQEKIESFANGGLLLIKNELEQDAEAAADDLFFVKMLST